MKNLKLIGMFEFFFDTLSVIAVIVSVFYIYQDDFDTTFGLYLGIATIVSWAFLKTIFIIAKSIVKIKNHITNQNK